VSHGCDSVAAFFGGHVRHQTASLFFDRFDKRVELVVIVKTAIAFFFSMTTKSIISLMVSLKFGCKNPAP
jgi:hypothetical protein